MTGVSERSYPAIRLEGSFHNPRGKSPLVPPHIEIPNWVVDRPDSEFPDRLAQMGNGLSFAWWLFEEVKACRRALFNVRRGGLSDVLGALNQRRGALVDTVGGLARLVAPRWSEIEALLVGGEGGLCEEATGDADAEEIAAFFPAGQSLGLQMVYDARLREEAGQWAGRRVGVWQLRGHGSDGADFSLGVLTPRLTANSQFSDRHFAVERESPASLLVRGVMLRRLSELHLGGAGGAKVGDPKPALAAAHLRAVPAKVGQRLPEAGLASAVNFLHAYPDAEDAWTVLSDWARRSATMLTVSKDGYCAAHRNALRYLRRAEDPERDDINVVLPLGWDDQNRVVRVTFTRPRAD